MVVTSEAGSFQNITEKIVLPHYHFGPRKPPTPPTPHFTERDSCAGWVLPTRTDRTNPYRVSCLSAQSSINPASLAWAITIRLAGITAMTIVTRAYLWQAAFHPKKVRIEFI
jgi:hypothetical protein